MSGQSPPAPTRGPNAGGDEDEGVGEESGGGASNEPVSLADLMPKVCMCIAVVYYIITQKCTHIVFSEMYVLHYIL